MVLNHEAPDFVPAPLMAAGLAAGLAAGGKGNSTGAGGPRLTVVAAAATPDSSAHPTPNGLAEVASVLSGDLTFDDMFDNGSRRGSLAGVLEHPQSEEEEDDDDDEAEAPEPPAAPPATLAAVQQKQQQQQQQDGAPAVAAPGSDDGSILCCGAGGGSDGASDDTSSSAASGLPPPRSAPLAVPPPPPRGPEAEAAAAAAVERAQRALNADAGCVQARAATDARAAKLGPEDFEILRVVGQGAFGKVFQVRARASGRVYAMKVMRKERILQRDHGEYVRTERDLLTAVEHPYIVTLRYSFQTPSKLYLVLDFINGGHLFFNLYRQGVFGEDVARLYAAEIVAALGYLHGRGIVHRDLKPENVLLDGDGHVRLTDFGLAKGGLHDAASRTNSFIGTMEYMAPEVVEGSGHGRAVDWWSTGILLYEMLSGVPPFRAKSRQALQQQILCAKPKWPRFLSSAALSLLKGLLARDPSLRLGSGPGGAEDVKKHAFFKGVCWRKLEARELESKFKPGVKCNLSVENFDKIWTEQRPYDSPCGTPTDPAAAGAFEGFTYVAPSFVHSALAGLRLGGGGGGASGGEEAAAAAAAGAPPAAPVVPATKS